VVAELLPTPTAASMRTAPSPMHRATPPHGPHIHARRPDAAPRRTRRIRAHGRRRPVSCTNSTYPSSTSFMCLPCHRDAHVAPPLPLVPAFPLHIPPMTQGCSTLETMGSCSGTAPSPLSSGSRWESVSPSFPCCSLPTYIWLCPPHRPSHSHYPPHAHCHSHSHPHPYLPNPRPTAAPRPLPSIPLSPSICTSSIDYK
jgi:hypothetical protein